MTKRHTEKQIGNNLLTNWEKILSGMKHEFGNIH